MRNELGLAQEISLILCSIESLRHTAGARLEYLLALVDYQKLAQYLSQQRILPLVGSRLIALDNHAVPEWFREQLARELQLVRLRAMFSQAVTSPLLAALEHAGIPALPLKGPWFAERTYGDPGLRPFSDVDLLVPADKLGSARRLLVDGGYAPSFEARWSGDRPLLHELLVPRDPESPAIELHWRVHWYEQRFGESVLARSTRTAPAPRHPALIDELAMMLLFLARDGLLGLRLVADVAAWWDRFGASLSPRPLSQLGGSNPALAPAWRAAGQYASRVGGMPADAIGSGQALLPAERVAMRLSNWRLAGTDHQLVLDQKLVDLLLSPVGGRLDWLGRHLWPPSEHIRDIYGLEGAGARTEITQRVKHAGAITGQMLYHLFAGRTGRTG